MWNAPQYLKFESERTQPCRDLVHRIVLEKVDRVMDLGCGPGNSTQVLRERWRAADITGLDNSQEMLAKARQSETGGRWMPGDIAEWALEPKEEFDLVFSNAALHWVPDHEKLFPRLLKRTKGALAAQMPGNWKGPNHELMRALAASSRWSRWFPELPPRYVRDVDFYYDLLSPMVSHLELWQTEYVHIMKDAEAIVEWYKGSGLRPYLDALSSVEDRAEFTAGYLDGVRAFYKPQPDGRILFPFQRLFLVAYR